MVSPRHQPANLHQPPPPLLPKKVGCQVLLLHEPRWLANELVSK